MGKRKSENAIVDARNALQEEEHRYLRSHGWTYTCDTPSSHWLWRKLTLKGEVLLVDTGLAISIQQGARAIGGTW